MTIEFLAPDNEQVLAYLREGEGETILIVANLSHHAQFVELDLDRFAGLEPIEMLGRTDFPVIGDHGYPLSLGPYGFYWLMIDGADENETHDDDVVEISGPLEAAFGTDGPLVDAVRRYIALQPWISGRMPRGGQTSVLDLIPVTPGEQDANMWMAIVKVEHASGTDDLYVVPLAISFEEDRLALENGNLISRIRREGVDGVLYDGLADEPFPRQDAECHPRRRDAAG